MPNYTNDHGLLVDASTDPPTVCGYLFDFGGKVFAPDGQVEITKEEANVHNKLLADAEWTAMLKHGKGLLYICGGKPETLVADWPGAHNITPTCIKRSKDGRTDVWFQLDGSRWHGVNIGDNQILRVKRLKK